MMHPDTVALVEKLYAERDAARAELAALRESDQWHECCDLADELTALRQRIEALADDWEGRASTGTPYRFAKELRAALAGAAPTEVQR